MGPGQDEALRASAPAFRETGGDVRKGTMTDGSTRGVRRLPVCGALLLLLSVVLGACATPAPSPGPTSGPTPDRGSGLRHCAYTDHDVGALAELEPVVGAVLDCAVVFSNDARTWEEWARPWFLDHGDPRYAWDEWVRNSGGRNRLIITQSLVPRDPPPDWRARGARGEYDGHAAALARTLVGAGLGSSTIRLAAEANGTWNHDHVGDDPSARTDWARFWARTVRTMRATPGAEFTFDWSVNAAERPIPFHQYYPGDEVVDVVGIDQYDSVPGSTARGRERWSELRTRPAGLDALAAFAERHGKPISVPEAGLVQPTSEGAGDNPAYVDGLRRFLADRPSDYVAYFDKNVRGTLRLAQVPESARAWRSWVRAS